MKRFLLILCAVTLVFGIGVTASAAAEEPTFPFSLQIDGGQEKTASPGDIITVVFTLSRTDAVAACLPERDPLRQHVF